jgi:hypothetical protein
MVVALEAEADRVGHRVVQAVETVVQPVVAEVVLEVSDLDMATEVLANARTVSDRIEQPVFGPGFVSELLALEADVVPFGVVRPLAEPVVVLPMIRVVHSHDRNGPPLEPVCPGLQRHWHGDGSRNAPISLGTRRAASMGSWKQ